MKTPVAIIIFNRPEHTRLLYEQLKRYEPRQLFIISDGPRDSFIGEDKFVDETRAIFSTIEWECEVYRDESSVNLGCKERVVTGLNWVFTYVDRAIILEDDCLPHPQFFKYCDELLAVYSDSEEIMSICGTKTFPGIVPKPDDFFFSRYNNCWGWATWKRSWALYDENFLHYSARDVILSLKEFLGSYRAAIYWYFLILKMRNGTINSWAYCWMISCYLRKGLHIYPSENMIINSGFGVGATHTVMPASYMPQCYGDVLSSPLNCPHEETPNGEADKWIEDNMYSKSLRIRMQWIMDKISKIF